MGRRPFTIGQPVRETLEMIAATVDFRSGVWCSGRPYSGRAGYVAQLEQQHFLERAPDGLLALTEEGAAEALRSCKGAR